MVFLDCKVRKLSSTRTYTHKMYVALIRTKCQDNMESYFNIFAELFSKYDYVFL